MMKKMLFLFLMIPAICSAQKDAHNLFELLSGKNVRGEETKLPELKSRELYSYFEAGKRPGTSLHITSDSVYYKIFAAYSKDSLPVIDFTCKELNVLAYCAQCLAGCNHKSDGWNEPCHRNACMYRYLWFIKDKSITKEGLIVEAKQ
jgi:hypothetical protein